MVMQCGNWPLSGPSQPIGHCLRCEATNFYSVTFQVMGQEVKDSIHPSCIFKVFFYFNKIGSLVWSEYTKWGKSGLQLFVWKIIQ